MKVTTMPQLQVALKAGRTRGSIVSTSFAKCDYRTGANKGAFYSTMVVFHQAKEVNGTFMVRAEFVGGKFAWVTPGPTWEATMDYEQ